MRIEFLIFLILKFLKMFIRAYIANPDVPKEDIIVLLAVSWSDDFDPKSSIKANRGAWMDKNCDIYL